MANLDGRLAAGASLRKVIALGLQASLTVALAGNAFVNRAP